MKKVLSLGLAVMTSVLLASCGGNGSKDTVDDVEKAGGEDTQKVEQPVDETPATGKEIVFYNGKVEIHDALEAYSKIYMEANPDVTVQIKSVGGGADYGEQLKAEFQSGKEPDIFVIDGTSGYKEWETKLADLSSETWVGDTDVSFTYDGKVYGFPVAVEAFGLAYNKEVLDAAEIDPATLTTQAAYAEAFAKLDSMKEELGIETVVSMAAGSEMTWVTGLHSMNAYLSQGLEYGDRTVVDLLNNGQVDEDKLNQYANWVELIFSNSDKNVLLTGNYDAQVGAFTSGKAAFLHQGNWIDPNLLQAREESGVVFEVGYAPHASLTDGNENIFVGVPSYYVINKDSANADVAKDFINSIASTPEGHNYMVNEANMIPAFRSVSEIPTAPLSADVFENWVVTEKMDTWLFGEMPSGFGMENLGPIYEMFAKDAVTKEQFVQLITAEIAKIAQ